MLIAGSGGETLETLTTALVKLLEAQPPLMEVVPATGYIGRVISTMAKVGGAGQKPGLLVIHQLSRSSACAEALAKCDTAGTYYAYTSNSQIHSIQIVQIHSMIILPPFLQSCYILWLARDS